MIGFSHVNSSKKETEVSLKLSKTLKKGAYWVTVSDNSKPKTVVVMQFEVVKNLPLSKKRQPTVGSCAKWLAEQGSKKWAFEAYQFGKNGETDKNILSACGMSQ
ncbi:MAG: hypothetical protein B6247_01475 [Candidatus Parabeggiatoa sp. nov. 2]|nr:MAG: hypothetical protein B6247_01475 [Beggiatoa sp. 4572_84]